MPVYVSPPGPLPVLLPSSAASAAEAAVAATTAWSSPPAVGSTPPVAITGANSEAPSTMAPLPAGINANVNTTWACNSGP